jgi:RHH-type transcriptional regulator, rel operon repressor / antitoxin RelB
MLSIRLPKKMEEELELISKRTERPKSYFIRKALEKYLEDLKDYTMALDRLSDKKAEYLTPEEASKYLGF